MAYIEGDAPTLVLASASPRRREILAQVGITFEVLPGDVDEVLTPGLELEVAIQDLAARKAMSVAPMRPGCVILGADTVVCQDDTVFGKPLDSEDAAAMLKCLSGRSHEVITGIALLLDGRLVSDAVHTTVTFKPLSNDEIGAYIKTGEPLDAAGSYAIQGRGALFVTRLSGCYYNVVGLPIQRLGMLLSSFDISVPAFWR